MGAVEVFLPLHVQRIAHSAHYQESGIILQSPDRASPAAARLGRKICQEGHRKVTTDPAKVAIGGARETQIVYCRFWFKTQCLEVANYRWHAAYKLGDLAFWGTPLARLQGREMTNSDISTRNSTPSHTTVGEWCNASKEMRELLEMSRSCAWVFPIHLPRANSSRGFALSSPSIPNQGLPKQEMITEPGGLVLEP